MSAIRINVIGGSGSGASTLGRLLATAYAVPFFDSDDYYHEPTDPPFQTQRTPQSRYDLICRDLPADANWVLSGGVMGWEPYPELAFTLVILLITPAAVRMSRLRERERNRFGERIAPGGDLYETHEEFIQWASRYDVGDVPGKTLQRHEAYLLSQTCPALKLSGTLPVESLTNQVTAFLRSTG